MLLQPELKEELKALEKIAGDLTSSSMKLANGSKEQAASIEKTSSTLEEASSMLHKTTENTQQADILAQKAKEYGLSNINKATIANPKTFEKILKIIKSEQDYMDDMLGDSRKTAPKSVNQSAGLSQASMQAMHRCQAA